MREEKYTDMSLTDEQASLLGFKSLSMPEQYIQVKDVRYTLDEFNRIGELLLGRNLTDDQQVVLEYLKSRYHDRAFPFDLVGGLNSRFFSGPDWETDKVLKAYGGLNSREQFQVLAAFAEWGMANE